MQEKMNLKRRDFLTRAGYAGAAAMVGATLAPLDGVSRVLDTALPNRASVELATVGAEDFSVLRGEMFSIRQAGHSVSHSSRLINITPHAVSSESPGTRPPFSILFSVPIPSGLEQGQYSISHPRIGTMDLFMVPVDLPEAKVKLEAIFG